VRQGLLEGRDFTAIDNKKIASSLYSFAEKLRGGSGKGWTPIFERRLAIKLCGPLGSAV